MVANDNDAASTNVVRLPRPRVEALDDHAAAVRAFLAAGRGESNRRPRSGALARSLADHDRVRRPVVDLPCQRHDPNLWFGETPVELERAKALGAACPIRLACLAVAVDHAEYAGVWGGHIFDRGQIVAHKRPRGRPRKLPTQHAASPHRTAPAELADGSAELRAAAARLYDAECALHSAHQSHIDAWIDAANRSLHAAVTDYLAVATSSGLESRSEVG
jgi:WhiB family redox-sensing transcriptional regulator